MAVSPFFFILDATVIFSANERLKFSWLIHGLIDDFWVPQNVGLTAPLPTLAVALTGVVGVLTAFLIFQSGTRD